MVNKLEGIGILVCVGIMALALFLLRMDGESSLISQLDTQSQTAAVVVASDETGKTIANAVDRSGTVKQLIVDDVVVGEGPEVQTGDTVQVHYIGTLQNGQQFDNSYTRGTPFSFTVGQGKVIAGWEQGVVGMQKGGQRILVIPSELAYGNKAVGPIPANATLVFAIELLDIE